LVGYLGKDMDKETILKEQEDAVLAIVWAGTEGEIEIPAEVEQEVKELGNPTTGAATVYLVYRPLAEEATVT
jgi:hypothetical protein